MGSKTIYILLLLMIIALYPINGFAMKGGGDPYAFLRLGAGARASGMGGAFAAIADDGTAVYWNPAGLAITKGTEITSMFSSIPEIDAGYYYLSICPKQSESNAWGVSIIQFSIDDIKKTIEDEIVEWREIGRFEDKETAYIISYGSEFIENLVFWGGNLKYITHDIDEYKGSGLGIDLGLLADIHEIFPVFKKKSLKEVKLGFIFRINGKKKWQQLKEEDKATTSGELGLAITPISKKNCKWILSSALVREKDHPTTFSLGTEFQSKLPVGIIILRCGINNAYWDKLKSLDMGKKDGYEILSRLDYAKKYCLGLGAELGMVQIDYAVLFGEFERRHQISSTLRF